MKIFESRRPIATLAAVLLCLSPMTALSGCGSSTGDTADTIDPSVTAPVVPETLPELLDDRKPTLTDTYANRLTNAFANRKPKPATDFTYVVGESGVTITEYIGGDIVVVIPEEIEGKPVVALGEKAFAGRGNLNGVSIPDSVSHIASGAFAGCQSLVILRTPLAAATGSQHFGSLFGATTYETNGSYVPAKLATLILTRGDTISPYAFYDCNFEAIFLPETVTRIGEFAFYGNDRLAYIPLEKTALESVGEHAFTNCRALLSLELPATVNAMGFAMLEGCGKLETLTLPFIGAPRGVVELPGVEETETDGEESLTRDHLGYIFGARAYTHTAGYIPASLITVILLPGCGDIPANAFFECASIREIVLPEGVTSIGRRAFYGCARLSEITLPDSVTSVGDDAFHGCIRLVDLTVGKGVTTLGVQVFMDCLSLKTVTLPAGVTYLPNSAFAGCRSLETLTAPGVVSQGEKVFHRCEKLTGWGSDTDKPAAS